MLQLLAEEGLGADVSTVGELEFALRAGIAGERLVIHGNNKEDELLRRSAEAGALIVLDSLDELERARAIGAKRCLIRVTPGIEADTHEAVEDRASRLEVRPAARRRSRGDPPLARVPRACTCTSARSCCTSARR